MTTPQASNQLSETVKLVHKVAIIHDHKVLLLRRGPDESTRPNCWDLPGGNAEWPTSPTNIGEFHRNDIAREVLEETGLHLNFTLFTPKRLCILQTYFEPNRPMYTIRCGWRIDLPEEEVQPKITVSNEHTEFAWMSFDDALQADFGGQSGSFMVPLLEAAFDSVS